MPMQTLILGQDYKTDNGENSKLNEILFSTKDKSIVGINVRISRSVPNLFIPLQPQINNKKSQQKGMIHFSKRTIIHTNEKSKSQLFGVMVDSNSYRPNYFLIKIGRKIFSVAQELLDNISSGAPTLSSKVEISKIPVYLSDELATREANFTLTKFYEANYSSISNIEVEVISGTAYLTGTCQFNDQSISIERFIRSIDGILSIQNEIVCYAELEIVIAKKLADANIFHDGFVSIKIYNNKIALKGNVGSQKSIDRALSIIQELASIRLIENNIKLKS